MPRAEPPETSEGRADDSVGVPTSAPAYEEDRRFALLFTSHPLPMWIFDPESLRFLDVNDAAVRAYGYTRDEFLRMTIADIGPAEDVPRLLAAISGGANASQVLGIWRHRRKDGRRIDVEAMTTTFLVDGRRLPLVLVHDITEQTRLGGYRSLDYAVTRGLAEAANVEVGTPHVLQAICDALGFDIGELWRVDGHRGVIRWTGAWHRPADFADRFEDASRGFFMGLGEGLPGRAWRTERPVVVEDIEREENVLRHDPARVAGLHGALALPLFSRGRVVGALVFFMRSLIQLDEPLLDLFSDLGHRVGQALEADASVRSSARFEERFLTELRATPVPVVLSRAGDGTLMEVNDAFLEFFGYARNEVLGRSSLDFGMWVDPDSRARIIHRLQSGHAVRGEEAAFRTKAGEVRDALVFMEVIRHEDEPTILTMLVDLTERKAMQQRLLDSERLAAMGQTAAFLAHEINTPLTNISLLTAAAARQNRDPEVAEKLRRVDGQRRLASSIIVNLLTLAGSRQLVPVDVDLRSPTQEAVAEARMLLRDGVELRVDLGLAAVPVRADPVRMRQAVFNLLKNAIEATDRGAVAVALQDRGEAVEVSVSDTGRGIPPDVLANLFHPFFTTKAVGEGTGLGLAFCRSVVDAHGGTVDVDSKVGEGTRFTIRLPRTPAAG